MALTKHDLFYLFHHVVYFFMLALYGTKQLFLLLFSQLADLFRARCPLDPVLLQKAS